MARTCAQNKAAFKKGFVVSIERFSANSGQFFYKLWWGNTWLICHKLTGQKPCLRLTTRKASVLLSDNISFNVQTNLVQLTFCSLAFWLKTPQSVCPLGSLSICTLCSNHLCVLRFSRLKRKTCAKANVQAFQWLNVKHNYTVVTTIVRVGRANLVQAMVHISSNTTCSISCDKI